MANRKSFTWLLQGALVFVVAVTEANYARAQQTLPAAAKGWWYYTGIVQEGGYAADPVTACIATARNHMGTALVAMRPDGDPSAYNCKYPHFMGAPAYPAWYGTTILVCNPGYVPVSPGICVARTEPPPPSRPPGSCNAGDAGGPGATRGNPVQVASGAKVQTENDLVAGPEAWLNITRTYRSFHQSGKGQSGGLGWSFSFDRQFTVNRGLYNDGIPRVGGSFGDGSVFAFSRVNGSYVSRYDKGMALTALNADYSEWLLTTPDGQIEHYKKLGDAFKMISVHASNGDTATYSYDADNHLVTITARSGRTVRIAWHADEVVSIDGPEGGVRYEYSQAGEPGQASITGMARLEAVHFHDRDGATFASKHYHYEDERQRYLLTGITDENGARFATYVYDDFGAVLLSEHAGGADRTSFSYPSSTSRKITDALGTERDIRISYGYDGRGRITAESQPAGAGCSAGASEMSYTDEGDLASSTNFNGQKTCFTIDATRALETRRIAGLPAAMACPVSATNIAARSARMTSTQWHPAAQLKSVIAEANRMTTYTYNGQTGADGKIVQCAASAVLPTGKPIAVLCSKTEQATSDNNGTLGFAAARTGPARTWRYRYDAEGRLVSRVGPQDARGNAESDSFTYYSDSTDTHFAGDLASTTDALGNVTQFRAYRSDGLATDIKLFDGQTLSLTYGARQLLATSTVADSAGATQTTRYEYDNAGQLTRTTTPDGAATQFEFDPAHRLTDLRDSSGNHIHYVRDAMGNVTREEVRGPGGALLSQSQRIFDTLGRLQNLRRGDQDAGIRFTYDRGGNLTSVTDQLGRVTSQLFDIQDRVLAQSLPAPAPGAAAPSIGFTWSQQNQMLSVTDPRKLVTRYIVDGLNQRTGVSSPDTGSTTTVFDAAGNPDTQVDAAGHKTIYRFDAARRITQIGTTSFEYGEAGKAAGRLTKMSDASGQTLYEYDGFGRLLVKKQTIGSGPSARPFALAYAYGSTGSATGHLTTLTYPSGNRVDMVYGGDGRVDGMTVTAPGSRPQGILSGIEYQPSGVVSRWVWGNSLSRVPNNYERRFDLEGRLASYPLGHTGSGGTVRTLAFDAAGRITASSHSGNPTATALDQRYEYDGLDRLTGFTANGSSQRFQYDANGNRTQTVFGASTYRNAIHANSNRLLSTTGPGAARQNTYDASGNLTDDGTIKYSYSSEGRLAGVLTGGVSTNFLYNGLGQRTMKSNAAGATLYYVYDESGRLLGEYDGKGNAIQETVYLDDLPVAVLKPAAQQTARANLFYVYADHLQAPRVLTRAADNKMVWRWDNADPFGVTQPDENPGKLGAFTYNMRFPGQVFDRETSTYYNYFRDYDPQLGRYIQSDPIGLEGGINTYAYVGGNPVAYSDFLGLAPGDFYRTANLAAVAAITDIFPMTARSGNEWSGRVYQMPNGKYSYTKPAEGNTKNIGKVPPLECPNGGKNVGMYHTHPNVATAANGTGNPNIVSGGDQIWGDREGAIFIGAPNKNVLRYTANGTAFDGKVDIIGRVR